MSCQKSDPCICAEISGIATGQTFHGIYIWRKVVQKNHFWREINEFSPLFNHKWIKIMLIQGKSKFLLALSRIIFFPEGTVTNPTIWLVFSAVRNFLSLPYFRCYFYKYISFFRLGSIFKQKRRSLPQAMINWLNLSFLSLQSLRLTKNIGFEMYLNK